ncbi:uncharacterized protein FOMMEDRAFT_86412, partial [Fomitiporia mediterranea MF3/22]|uniref:uncharacterized protein n=1 Tax=Fomitiporia mediterranea (strain MF3/22) TaxID=694068 RepID=UPI0004409B20
DCLHSNCLFSRSYTHPYSCHSLSCTQMMSLSVKNPILTSPVKCTQCTVQETDPALAGQY